MDYTEQLKAIFATLAAQGYICEEDSIVGALTEYLERFDIQAEQTTIKEFIGQN